MSYYSKNNIYIINIMDIYNDDCFNVFSKIKEKINLVLVDLPYGQTDCKWDENIDLNKMWDELKKICTNNCIYVFFCTTKFGYQLIKSNPCWFRYDLVWEKSKAVGFLAANKIPLRKHEMIYIFGFTGDDLECKRNLELRKYAENVKNFIDKPYAQIKKDIGNRGIQKFYEFKTSQFAIPTKNNYNKLIELYKINEMEGFKTYDKLKELKEKCEKKTYNPQKTKGKPYKVKEHLSNVDIYGQKRIPLSENKTGDRHPHSILKFNQPQKSLHPTQKPVDLCEWLIKTYSNEGDLILDFTAGSMSTGEACINTKRRFICIEKDKDIYEIGKERLLNICPDVNCH